MMGSFKKNVLVLGLAKSGFAAAVLLRKLGATVTVNDGKEQENAAISELQNIGIRVVCGSHPLELLEGIDLVVKNPGIPYTNQLVSKAIEKKIPIITEVELAYKISRAPFIGITGSNGKTTTTTLIFEMLREKNPLIAGNIGTVACEVAQEATEDNIIVTELSSFQLMGTISFAPKVAVLLNIFDAHLDYHGTKEAYIEAKANIFAHQSNTDYAVYNADDKIASKIVENVKAIKVPFSSEQKVDGAYIEADTLYFKGERIISIADIVLPGKHNLENILSAICAAKLSGATNEVICQTLTTFTGVKHRLQYVATIEGRKFFNDSKATNILATQKALSAFQTESIILLAGGLDRGNEFDDLIPYLTNTKVLITFGQTAKKLERIAGVASVQIIIHVDSMEEAVKIAYTNSKSGDVILLSPACASWDQYKTFEERGDIFINNVHMIR